MQAAVAEFESARDRKHHPLFNLPEEDLDFILHFMMASGSLKEMAQLYGVSYPTIRITLDRVIENLRRTVKGQPKDPVIDMLAGLVERGDIKAGTARSIRSAYQKALEQYSGKEQVR
jgi:hypothetical protein